MKAHSLCIFACNERAAIHHQNSTLHEGTKYQKHMQAHINKMKNSCKTLKMMKIKSQFIELFLFSVKAIEAEAKIERLDVAQHNIEKIQFHIVI